MITVRPSNLLRIVVLIFGLQALLAEEIIVTSAPGPNGVNAKDPYFDSISGNDSHFEHIWVGCNPYGIDESCLAQLDAYFESEPIWVSEQLQNRAFASWRLPEAVLNERNRAMRFGYDDYLIESLPVWGNVFDDRILDRNATVARIVQDERCRSLDSSEAGIETQLEGYCEAEELFRYAALLNACVTSNARVRYFVARPMVSKRTPRTKLDALLLKAYYREMWVYAKCREAPLEAILASGETKPMSFMGAEEVREEVQEAHDTALRIAAKAGLQWATTSYLPRDEGMTYWEDLYEINPLLTHRFLAALGPGLTAEERSVHAYRAYALLENPEIKPSWFLRSLNGSGYADQTLMEVPEVLDTSLTFPWEQTDQPSRSQE